MGGAVTTLAVKYKDPRKLKPRPTPPTHTPRRIKIAGSITEFGFINAVLIDGFDGIVAGMPGSRLLQLTFHNVIVFVKTEKQHSDYRDK